MRINDKALGAISSILLIIAGAMFAWLAVMTVKSLLFPPDNPLPAHAFQIMGTGLLCVILPIAGLLLSAAFFEYKEPQAKLVWCAFGLIAGLCVSGFVANVVFMRESILWNLAPDFMTRQFWDTL